MVDAFQTNIKKIRIKPENLPPIIVKDETTLGQYYFRYKILSQDEQTSSAFFPVQAVDARDFSSVTVNLRTVSDGQKFVLSWTSPDIYLTQYDLYVAWSTDGTTYTDYSYSGRSTGNSFVIDIPSTPINYRSEDGNHKAKFIIQVPTSPQILNTPAQLYVSASGVSTQVTPVDGNATG